MSSNFCVCCGAEIPEGTQVCLRCQKNGGPLPHKTADEMFRELGYELEWSNGRDFHYRQGIYTIVIHLDGYGRRGVYKMRDWRMTPEEILACAQLIKEMEEQK